MKKAAAPELQLHFDAALARSFTEQPERGVGRHLWSVSQEEGVAHEDHGGGG